MEILIAVIFILAIPTLAAIAFRRTKQAEAAALERALNDIPEQAVEATFSQMNKALELESGYLMKKDWDALVLQSQPLLKSAKAIKQSVLCELPYCDKIEFIANCCKDPQYREKRNTQYKAAELERCNELFSDIDGGKSLDAQQRDAVVTDEYSNLVIAGAGSGKTSVVVGKIKYLVERWGIDPSEILVTSFTKASVEDLEQRIEGSGISGVSTRTFHSLGLRVLGNGYATAPDNALDRFVSSYLSDELLKHPLQAAAFLEFFGLQCLAPDDSLDIKSAEERMQTLKAQDLRTLKGHLAESRSEYARETLRGEHVNSIEELMIANFLFLNGVNYEYEKPYDHPIPDELKGGGHRAYQPDFYLCDYDIWFEHFGIDEDGRVPWMKTQVEEQGYLDGMAWKRELHSACGTKLIESYSYWNKDQDLLNRIKELLLSNGVALNNDPERNARVCAQLMRDERLFSSMTSLVSTFISLMKSSNTTCFEVSDKARIAYRGSGAMWRRYELFITFAEPIARGYQESLDNAPVPFIDFDDMINKATRAIAENGFEDTYRYIIVDEYQDISLSRFGLLNAIRNATGAKLMCVGDDWQSIYRFAGSDVTLFTNFEKLVGYHEKLHIEHTYRNSQELVDIASRFVLKNPDQLRKQVISKAAKPENAAVSIVSHSNQKTAFLYALENLLGEKDTGGEIKILGRNRKDLERIFPKFTSYKQLSFRDPRRSRANESKYDKVVVYHFPDGSIKEIGYMTIHKSKGLQADNIIVIGLVNEPYGFPNMVVDDPILSLLLADSDRYDFAEERRLFYVALTRTKQRVWLVTHEEISNPGRSIFVTELLSDNKDTIPLYAETKGEITISCPRCGGPMIKKKSSDGREFIACCNYPFCNKTYSDIRILNDRKKCPECGGWLTRRKRKDGTEFYGCTNFPNYCYYTMNLDGTGGSAQKPSSMSDHQSSKPRYSFESVSLETRSPSGKTQTPANKASKERVPDCPICGAPMVIIKGPYGDFYGCPKYPKCEGKRTLGRRP